jgi:hypothetical protein
MDVGYYYPEFDPVAGGEVLADALSSHEANFPESRSKVFDLLWRFSVDNPAVQLAHSDLIQEVMEA